MASPEIDEADVAAVAEVVRSGRLALGSRTEAFERAIADFSGVEHAVAVSSGTAALHLAVEGLGLGPGDEMLVPSFTFAASVNVAFFTGATPVFVDILPDVFTLDPEDVRRKIGPKTKAIMAVDVFGHPAEWQELEEISSRTGVAVIDDSCEAIGAEYRGRRLGSFGEAAAFAFYPNKQITTGEGGILVTDRDDLASHARSLRNQGRDAMGAWLEHQRLGYNYRLDEMSAALGLSQMGKLPEILARRERVARMYDERLATVEGVEAPRVREGVRVSWFVYVVRLTGESDRDAVIERLARRGIPARGYFSPIHLQPYVRERLGDLRGTLPVTEDATRRTLALPFHNQLTEAQVERVVEALADAVGEGAP